MIRKQSLRIFHLVEISIPMSINNFCLQTLQILLGELFGTKLVDWESLKISGIFFACCVLVNVKFTQTFIYGDNRFIHVFSQFLDDSSSCL